MKKDLSKAFQEAQGNVGNWSLPDVRALLDFIAVSRASSHIDWEPGDEEWGRVLEGNAVVAFVCAKVPLVVLHKSLIELVSSINKDGGPLVVVAESFGSESYSVDRQVLESLFGHCITVNISCDSLSITDLWWATV